MVDGNGRRIPLDPFDPYQATLRGEWIDLYGKAGGKTAEKPCVRSVHSSVQSCPKKKGVDIRYEYTDGKGVAGAKYEIMVPGGGVLRSGKLNKQGEAHEEDLPEDIDQVDFRFYDDPLMVEVIERPRPHGFVPPAPDYIEKTGEEGTLASVASWTWGSLQGDFQEDPSLGQIAFGTVITLIPIVDQVCDVRDISANLGKLIIDSRYNEAGVWIGLTLSIVGAFPEVGSLIKGAGTAVLKKGAKASNALKLPELLQCLNSLAKLNGPKWLKQLIEEMPRYAKWTIDKLDEILKLIGEKLATLKKWVSEKVAHQISEIEAKLTHVRGIAKEKIENVFNKFKKALDDLLDTGERHKKSVQTRPSHNQGSPGVITQEAKALKATERTIKEAAQAACMSDAASKQIFDICTRERCYIRMRRSNPKAKELLEAGKATPKPDFLLMKTINEEDVKLGIAAEDIGKLGYFHPAELLHNSGRRLEDLQGKEKARYFERLKEYLIRKKEVEHYVKDGKIKWSEDSYLVKKGEKNTFPDGTPDNAGAGMDYTGDNDIFDIVDESGKTLPKGKRDAIVKELKSAHVEHGPEMNFKEDNPEKFNVPANKQGHETRVNRHTEGTEKSEPLTEFGPDGHLNKNSYVDYTGEGQRDLGRYNK